MLCEYRKEVPEGSPSAPQPPPLLALAKPMGLTSKHAQRQLQKGDKYQHKASVPWHSPFLRQRRETEERKSGSEELLSVLSGASQLPLHASRPSPVILHFVPMRYIIALLVDIQPMCGDVLQLLTARHRNRVQANLPDMEFAYTQTLISSEMHFV